MEMTIESQVPESAGRIRIDKYLAERFTYFSRTRWQREISAGLIRVNGKVVRTTHQTLRPGDVIRYTGSGREEPAVDDSFAILHEDEYLLAINKSGNIPVHPAGRYFNHTLLMRLQAERDEKLYPVHRLDRETSGIILFSRDNNLTSNLQSSLREGEKRYLAIVLGEREMDSFVVDTPLGDARNSLIRKKREAFPGAPEEAMTRFRCLRRFPPYSLMEAELVTGRLHQIRAHLLSVNLPIIGDKMYGVDENCYLDFISGKSEGITERLHFSRTALHAHTLTLQHPVTGRRLRLTAPLLEDMKEFLLLHRVHPESLDNGSTV